MNITNVKDSERHDRYDFLPVSVSAESNAENAGSLWLTQELKSEQDDDDEDPKDTRYGEEEKSESLSQKRRAYACKDCGKMVDYYKVERHMRTHSGERPYVCSECPRSFARSDSLRVHMRGHTGDHPYQCAQCAEHFSRADMLRAHTRLHSGETFRCEVCSRDFTKAERLRTHMLLHAGDKEFKCVDCDRRFARADNLRAHIKTHNGERKHCITEVGTKSDDDSKVFDTIETEGAENVVARKKKRRSEVLLSCELCPRKFPIACRLATHMKVHNGQKDYVCGTCGKKFALAYRLVMHMRTHTGERPFVCKHCGKTFARAHNLKQHERVHTGVKPYKCTICNKCYTQTKTLKEHMRIHTGEKPFQCNVCARYFTRYDNLKVHLLTHDDNKRHMCPECGKKYSDFRCFQKHVESHHASDSSGDMRYSCDICPMNFMSYRALRLHVQTHEVASSQPAAPETTAVIQEHEEEDPGEIDESVLLCGACGTAYTLQATNKSEIVYQKNCNCPIDEEQFSVLGALDEDHTINSKSLEEIVDDNLLYNIDNEELVVCSNE